MNKYFIGFMCLLFASCIDNEARWYFNKGHDEFIEMNFKASIDDMSSAILLKPDYSAAYFERANDYYNMGALDKALDDYSRAIKYNPNYAIAYRLRGIVKISIVDTMNAFKDWHTALELGDDRTAYYLIKYHKVTKDSIN